MSLLRSATRCIANQAKHEHLNAFLSRPPASLVTEKVKHADEQHERGTLNGRLIAIKDNICTEDLPTTAASGILRNFISPYDATVVSKLRDAGAIIAGKTNLDEFGMGSHSVNSHFGPVSYAKEDGSGNSTQDSFSAGGSSGGSAVAVATEQCWAALGTDTGGSVRLPAAYTGVVGFKPSYGLLSRWGVIAYANSLDTVGVLARDVNTTREVFRLLNEHDPKDPTSLSPTTRATLATHHRNGKAPKTLRIGVPAEYNIHELSPAVRTSWRNTLASLSHHAKHHLSTPIEIVPISLPITPHALSAYYILAPAEASSNLAKYDGVRYGSSDAPSDHVLFSHTRGAGFGDEVKRRILLGTYSLSASAMDNYFVQAQRVRRLVQRDFDRVFRAGNPLLRGRVVDEGEVEGDGVDVLVHPTAPTLPPTLEQVEGQSSLEGYVNDVFTVPASLAGLPAISVPVKCEEAGGESWHCGMQVVGQYGSDERVLDVAELLEQSVGRVH